MHVDFFQARCLGIKAGGSTAGGEEGTFEFCTCGSLLPMGPMLGIGTTLTTCV